MEKLSNLSIGLAASTLLFIILYIREKIKPKTEAEILYEKEKRKERDDLKLTKIAAIKKLDEEFKKLAKPVVFNGCSHNEPIYDSYSLTLGVTDGDSNAKSFTFSGTNDLLEENAPFFMSIWRTHIMNRKASPMDVLF
jgi:hypothetical protein